MSTLIYPPGPLQFFDSVPPIVVTESDRGGGVDCNGLGTWCIAIQGLGESSGTDRTLAGKIQESNDTSTWTDVSGATFELATAEFGDSYFQVIVFQRTKRYLAHTRTLTGTNPQFEFTAIIGVSTKPYLFNGTL